MPSLHELAQQLAADPENADAIMDTYLAENPNALHLLEILITQMERIRRQVRMIAGETEREQDFRARFIKAQNSVDTAAHALRDLYEYLKHHHGN